MDTHNPATIVQFVYDVFKPTSASAKFKVTVNLFDPRPYWKRTCHQALVHAIKLPQAYNGSITNALPLVVDTGASVCITPQHEDFIFYAIANRRSKIYPRPLLWQVKVLSVGRLEIRLAR